MNTYIDYLIDIGRNECVPKTEELITKKLSYRRYLEEYWKALDDEKLILLFKGLVIMEEYWFSSGELIGSTTDTKFVYHEIRVRHLDNDYSLGNWAYVYSSNPYVPLDTGDRHGAQTIYDYLRWQSDLEKRIRKEKEDAEIRKAERKRLKAEAHAERLRKKEIRDRELGYRK